MFDLEAPTLQMRQISVAVFAAVAMSIAAPAAAELYELSVTRKSSNIYAVDGKQIILQTRYCYVYAYSEQAILKSNGYGGSLIFVDSKDNCDLKAAYGVSRQPPGKYAVKVSHEDDDWYEVWGSNNYIKTSMCLKLALSQDAVLIMNSYGGRLVFDDGQSCTVEAVYAKLRL